MACGKCLNKLRACSYELTPLPPRTTCVATCPVWNDLLNKLVHSGMCLAGGMDCRFKCHSGNPQCAIGES
jgi:hypothetical protein